MAKDRVQVRYIIVDDPNANVIPRENSEGAARGHGFLDTGIRVLRNYKAADWIIKALIAAKPKKFDITVVWKNGASICFGFIPDEHDCDEEFSLGITLFGMAQLAYGRPDLPEVQTILKLINRDMALHILEDYDIGEGNDAELVGDDWTGDDWTAQLREP